MTGKSSWFRIEKKKEEKMLGEKQGRRKTSERKEGTDKQPVNVFFVPYTPEGELRKHLQRQEDMCNFKLRLKYVKTLGSTVADVLTISDPFRAHCGWKCNMCNVKAGEIKLSVLSMQRVERKPSILVRRRRQGGNSRKSTILFCKTILINQHWVTT